MDSSTKEEVMQEVADSIKELDTNDLQKLRGVITGIKLARDAERAAG